ncbi:argininosuccinate lyase [Prauserella rugosa]|uniref:Argininosuccinate lyase n=1 Tax=Prauserella rugosa TaxID=43354 RepID=A0A660C8Z5_9PSEU|nr:argininosuccinate lyase [Prauserella rugosa]KID29569.1 argininosuccinate lyase [Prauserella sp. Am3]TWH18337.1 argininosuccinate lyase [Prauserella rugosa]
MPAERISRERLTEPPGEIYTATVLEPSFRFMLAEYYDALLETNKAWSVMLGDTGIVEPDHVRRLLSALNLMSAEGAESLSEFNPAYEYFYSHIENRLTELAGPDAAGEINLGRTRPEPLTRMALRPRILLLVDRLVAVIERLLDIAARESATVMPQWTHMQPAQPSTLGHYLLGVTDALLRDVRRLAAAYRTTNACTLGCGALAGTSYAVDRELVADLLGFDEVRENTIDCVASGDYGLETTAAVANLGITLSRLCEDLYLWHTDEFGLVEIGDAFAGSSSMMPQKKNAYPFEYVRARGARTVGEMVSAFGALHNTNFGDIKDVEEEMVPPLFRTCDETATSLRLLEGTLGTLVVHRERCAARAASGFSTATELAAVLHRRTDLDYRSAHRVVGHLVLLATTAGRCPADVDAALVDQAAREVLGRDAGLSDEQVRDALDPARFVSAHQVAGGPAAEPVRQALAGAHSAVADWRDWLNTARSTVDDAARALAARVEEYVGGGAGD